MGPIDRSIDRSISDGYTSILLKELRVRMRFQSRLGTPSVSIEIAKISLFTGLPHFLWRRKCSASK